MRRALKPHKRIVVKLEIPVVHAAGSRKTLPRQYASNAEVNPQEMGCFLRPANAIEASSVLVVGCVGVP